MIGLDTNIFIYACDQSDSQRQATALKLIDSSADGVLFWQVACEFVAASRKLTAQGFTPTNAWARLAEYMDLFPLILPSPNVLQMARARHLEKGWSFWDAMIVEAAREAGADRLYSEDLPGGTVEGLEIINPFMP